MHQRALEAVIPLAAGSALISMALLNFTTLQGATILEWTGSFLAFYGLSKLKGTKTAMAIAGAVLAAGSLGDLILLGGMNPLEWATVNYMVFIHSATGSLAGSPLRR